MKALTYYQGVSMVEGKLKELGVNSTVQIINNPLITYCFNGGVVQCNRSTGITIVKYN